MSVRFFGHRHEHEAVAVQKRSPAPFGPPGTVILWRCRCGAVETQEVAGVWMLAQVRGQRDLTDTERIEADLEVRAAAVVKP